MNNTMKQLGKLKVPSLGLGCVNLSGLYGSPEVDASEIINFAYRNGVNFYDTADVYGKGTNEELLCSSFKKNNIARHEVLISTKCGVVWNRQNSFAPVIDNSPKYIKAACDASLKRLGTDYIDLFYLHRMATDDAIEEAIGAMQELVELGKIRHVGLSEVNSQTILKANHIHPLTAIQSEYSLMTREPEINGVLKTCRKLNIGFVAYSPLCRGLLSNNFSRAQLAKNDFRHKLPRFDAINLEKNIAIVKQLEKLAQDKKCSVVQLSLAWVLAQGHDVLPIPGTKSIKHLAENICASHIVLSNEEILQLNHLFPVGIVAGSRYSSTVLKTFNLS